jgi:hypothetical protein
LRVPQARIFQGIAAGLVGALAAGTALLGTSAAATAPTARRSLVPASMTPIEAGQITAQAKQMAAAMESVARPARIGWLILAQCYCLFADEATFQDALAAVFDAAGLLDHMNVRVQPNTYIKLNNRSAIRIPDIYYFRLNNAHTASGLGYINELKVGDQAMGRANYEAGQDSALIRQGYGLGANAVTKGQYLPVTAGIWWFAPNVAGFTANDFSFIAHLLSVGINVVYIEHNPGAQVWPRPETREQEAEDVQEIENGNATQAQDGLDNMIGPCLLFCRIS